MDDILPKTETKMIDAIDNLQKRFNNVRAGRANPSILDGIVVSYYGIDTPLRQLATISIPEARQLMIKPFDKSCLANIEKAIFEANIGLTPNNNGEVIILVVPVLTEETRKGYVKEVKKMAEDSKVQLRNIRQDANKHIQKLEGVTSDEQKELTEEVQKMINNYNKKVDEMLKNKETELLTV